MKQYIFYWINMFDQEVLSVLYIFVDQEKQKQNKKERLFLVCGFWVRNGENTGVWEARVPHPWPLSKPSTEKNQFTFLRISCPECIQSQRKVGILFFGRAVLSSLTRLPFKFSQTAPVQLQWFKRSHPQHTGGCQFTGEVVSGARLNSEWSWRCS